MFLPVLGAVTVGGTGPGSTYANGYGYRRWIRVAAKALPGGRLTDLRLRVDETLPGLKSVANGGNVESPSGFDVRFEVAGVKVSHEVEAYDPATGRWAGWVDCGALVPPTDLDIAWYYGKAGLSATEADPAGLWGSYWHGVWRMPDGQDLTGNGRHMTNSGIATGASILGMPAATLGKDSYFQLADPTFLDGISEWTTLIWVTPSALPNKAMISRIGGANFKHSIFYNPSHDGTDNTTMYAANSVWSDGNKPFLYGPTGSAVAGAARMIGYAAESGSLPKLYLDGALATGVDVVGSAGTGGLKVDAGEVLRIGANAGDNPEALRGAYSRLMIFKRALPAQWFYFHDLNLRSPRSVYGLSDEDAASDLNRSPILGPIHMDAPQGGDTDIPVIASASDPDGQAMTPSIIVAPASGQGSAVVAGGVVRYTPPATDGVYAFQVGAGDGLKTAKAGVRLTVGPGNGGGDWITVLSDPGTSGTFSANWVTRGETGTSAGYSASGIAIDCPTDSSTQAGRNVISKARASAGAVRLSFDVVRTGAPTGTNPGNLAILIGKGAGGQPDDLSTWTGAWSDTENQAGTTSVWLNFGYTNPNPASKLGAFRLRTNPGYDEVTPDSATIYPFTLSQKYRVVVTMNETAKTLTAKVLDASGATLGTATWTADAIGAVTGSVNVILRSKSTDAAFSNILLERKDTGGPVDPGTEFPTIGSTLTVGFGSGPSSYPTLAAAIAAANGTAARPDMIVLAAGTYTPGDITKSNLVIRSRSDVVAGTRPDVVLNGVFEIKGDRVFLWGWSKTDRKQFVVSGDNCTIMRGYHKGGNNPGNYGISNTGTDNRIGWIEFDDSKSGGIRCEQSSLRPRVKCIYNHDNVRWKDGDLTDINGMETLCFGSKSSSPAYYMNGIAELIRCENVAQGDKGDNEIISIKTHGNWVRLATVANPSSDRAGGAAAYINIRHSTAQTLEACYVRNAPSRIGVRDGPSSYNAATAAERPNWIINCKSESGAGGIRIDRGTCTAAEWDEKAEALEHWKKGDGDKPTQGEYVRAEGTIVAGCQGQLIIGDISSQSKPCANTKVYGHDPDDVSQPGDTGTEKQPTIPNLYSTGFVTAREVAATEVGYGAPFGTGWPGDKPTAT